MLKESALLAASTGILIYMISPSEEPAQPAPVEAEAPKKVAPLAPTSKDLWEYDDPDDGDDTFTFGEPVTFQEDGETDATDSSLLLPAGEIQPEAGRTRSRPVSGGGSSPSVNSRAPGTPGSMERPISRPPDRPPPVPEDD